MSDSTPDTTDTPAVDDAEILAAREEGISEMAEILQDEFAAVAMAAGQLRETSELAKKLSDDDLLKVLSQLRVGRAMDDFTMVYLSVKDEEAEAAASLLDELEDGSDGIASILGGDFDDDEFEDDYDDDDDLDDLDDFDDEDDDEEDHDDEEEAAADAK